MALFENIIALTKKWEGGLSRNPKDSASKYPSPYTYKGKTGWHTNKGITYKTFVDASKKFGFPNTANNFINMPEAIWNKIAKGLYWDALNLDTLKSDGVAFQLFSWKWGGSGWLKRFKNYLDSKHIEWDGNSNTIATAVNKLIDKQGETKTINDLSQQQAEYYKALNQPTFEKGWLNRVQDTTNYALNYIKSNIIKPVESQAKKKYNWLIIGAITIVTVYFLSKKK
jgi:lysozyme family protein